MDRINNHEEFIPRFAALICSVVFSGVTIMSTRSLNLSEERHIQICALIVSLFWLVFLALSLKNGVCFNPLKMFVLLAMSIGLLRYCGSISRNLIACLNEGTVGTDFMFHVSIAQAIKYHGIPSMLINSDSFFNYHFASHLIMAGLSKLIRIPVYFVYFYIYYVLFVPLYIYLILSVSQELKRQIFNHSRLSIPDLLTVYCFTITVIVPQNLSDELLDWKGSWIGSESFLVSIVFTLLFLRIIMALKRRNLASNRAISCVVDCVIIPIFIVIISLSKISTGLFFVFGISYYRLRMTEFKDKRTWILVIYYSLLFILLFLLPGRVETLFKSNIDLSAISPFHFIRTYLTEKNNIGIHILLLYLYTIILLYYRVRSVSLREIIFGRKYLLEEILIWICILGAIPGNIFEIKGGSAFYFCSVHQLMATILLIGFGASDIICAQFVLKLNKMIHSLKAPGLLVTIAVALCLTWNPAYSLVGIVKDTAGALRLSLEKGSSSIERNTYWQMISEIDEIAGDGREDYYLYVDKNADIWGHLKYARGYDSATYFFPAFTGIVAIGELYCEDGEVFYNNDEPYWTGWFKYNPSAGKMSLNDAIEKSVNDGKKGLFHIYNDTFEYIPLEV